MVTPLLLLVAVVLGPVAMAAAGLLAVAVLVLAGFALVEWLTGARVFGPFPEPTASPRARHQQ